MESFKQFCESSAIITDKKSVDIDADYDDPILDKFIANMKKTYNENVSLTYIQNAFKSVGDLIDNISAKYADGDIPDGIINKIAKGMFDKPYAELADTECKIINVLSIYYVISNK